MLSFVQYPDGPLNVCFTISWPSPSSDPAAVSLFLWGLNSPSLKQYPDSSWLSLSLLSQHLNNGHILYIEHLTLCRPLLLLPSIFPSSRCFPELLFTSGSQSVRASASASVLPMNIQDWFPLGWTCLISLLSKGLSRVFSSTIQKHQFFSTQPSLWSKSHIHMWVLEKP